MAKRIRRSHAQREAHRVLRRWGEFKLPIRVDKIATAVGIRVIDNVELPNKLSGLFYSDEDGPLIFVHKNDHLTRQRFTVAHELGHFFLHNRAEHTLQAPLMMARSGRSSEGTHNEEIQANQFAAELLMPQVLLETEIEKLFFITEEDIDDLAATFQVSPQAMGIRLYSLGYLE